LRLKFRISLPLFVSIFAGACLSGAEHALHPVIPQFIDQHCASCHDDTEMEADLDLWSLAENPLSSENLNIWVKAFDRVSNGEMPPPEKEQPGPVALNAFQAELSTAIIKAESALLAERGRSVKRRLNRYEYENSLRDLLYLPFIDIKDTLPEDPLAHGYNKVGEALDVSHVQMARYLKTAETALREAIAPQVEMPKATMHRYYTWQERGFRKGAGPNLRKTYPVIGYELRNDLLTRRDAETREWIRPDIGEASEYENREQEAMIMLMSTYEPAEIRFNSFRAPVSGYYHLKFSGYTVWMSLDFKTVTQGRRTEPITIYSETSPRILRRHGAFDFGPEPSVHEMTVWLKRGETIQPDATRLVRSRPPDFENPFEEEDGMPGVAFQWMDVDGPYFDEWPEKSHRSLFGDLAIQTDGLTPAAALERQIAALEEPPETPDQIAALRSKMPRSYVQVITKDPMGDAERLLKSFIQRAYRKPVAKSEYVRFLALIEDTLNKGFSFMDAMIAGYTAVLASPGYLYLESNVGELNAYALVERLSYFLWNSPPDEELLALAANGKILNHRAKRKQVERMLSDPKASRFVEAFLDFWLDLRNMGASGPDAELYPEYQLDDSLAEALPEETRLYFSKLIEENLSIKHVVDSDFVIINERLATLYDIPNVEGAQFRPVSLGEDSPRGGFMTQGSILKVTANGTTSSPVVRGAWIMERILGYHIPPPPPTVEAIESDIRGAQTIREQLALHRSVESCNTCHIKIDPAGFALENFDVMGGWRDVYRTTGKGIGEPIAGVGHDGQEFRFLMGLPVDATGTLPDGRTFSDIRELKQLLLQDERQLAKNFVEQLATYATGAPIRFSDRADIENILDRSRRSDYGLRTLIQELVNSDIFLYK
jgi:hypothetical protein